jgi:replicative DNA helicase
VLEKIDRLPPQNLDAERGVIGSVLLDNAVLDDIGFLSPEDFYRDSHQLVFGRIKAIRDAGQPADLVTLAEGMIVRGEYDRAGGDELMASIMASTPHAANGRYYAEIVRQKAHKRRLIQCATEMLGQCYADDRTSEELQAASEQFLFGCRDERGRNNRSRSVEAMRDAFERLTRRRAGEVLGVHTGLLGLDNMTDGLYPGQLVVIGARPSIGKTALGLTVAAHVSYEGGGWSMFVSLEMGATEIGERLISMRARVDGLRLRNGSIDAGETRAAAEAIEAVDSLDRLIIEDAPGMSLGDIGAAARQIKRQNGLDLIVVDYLQLMTAPPGMARANREERVAENSKGLKRLARELGVPVVLLSQLNRNVEQRPDKTPTLSDIRESGSVEQDADVVLLLHRPDYYDPMDRAGEADLIVAKQRNGPTGRIPLAFQRRHCLFTDLEANFVPPPVVQGPGVAW